MLTLLLFLRRHWRFTLAGILLLLVGIGAAYLAWPEPVKKATVNFEYNDIVPGQTTHQELIDKAGVFDNQYELNGYDVYEYNSAKSRYAPNRFYLRNDIVEMKELNYNPLQYKLNRAKFEDAYGTPTAVLYENLGAEFGQAINVWFYEKLGMAVFSRGDTYMVVKVQFFSPISKETYLDSWGKGLLTSQPSPAKFEKHTN